MTTARGFGLSAYLFAFMLLALALFGGRSAFGSQEPHVMDAWVRLPVVSGRPASGYVLLHGAAKDDHLVAVSSPKAERIEMHSVKAENGVMRMRAESRFALPAKGELVFAPGGSHLMLFGLAKDVKAGGEIPLTFRFQSGANITVSAQVKTMASAPKTGPQPATHHQH